MSAPWAGRTIDGRYVVEDLVGEGGMGVVLRARHQYTGATVALKILHPNLRKVGNLASRFLNEARAPAAIGHPGIVAVSDAGTTPEGDLYLVMELLQGHPLSALVRRGPMSLGDIARIGGEVLDALGAAHAAGFVHRDLKPDNIFITQPSGAAKLLDFGIAKVLAEMEAPGATATGALIGTVAYMSPEQLRDSRNVDLRTDLWAMGVTVYLMAAGRLPYEAQSLTELIAEMLRGPPRPIHTVMPSVPPALVEFLIRALAIDPAHRFASAAEMAAALRALAGAPTGASGPVAAQWTAPGVAPPPVFAPAWTAPPTGPLGMASSGSQATGGSGAKWALGAAGCAVAALLLAGVGGLFLWVRAGSGGGGRGKPPPARAECAGESCYHLGMRHEQGEGAPKNDFKAVELYKRSCDDGFMLGCNALGNSYKNGFGGLPKDYTQARRLYERVCDAGTMEGCHNLGVLYDAGLGVPQDHAKARAYFQRSCRGGNSPSCDRAR